jgi:signal transduction histidine kinase/DNA-binding response OmpR family regulator
MQIDEKGVNFSGFDRITHTFLDIADLMTSDISEDNLFTLILEKIHQMLSFHWALIFAIENNQVILKAYINTIDRIYKINPLFNVEDSAFIKKILETKNPFCIPDIQKDIDYIDIYEKDLPFISDIHSKIGIPVIIANKVIGVIYFESKEIDLYQPSHIFLAISFASYIAIAFQNQILKEEQRRRLIELGSIKTVFDAMNKSIELDELCVLLGESALKLFKCDVVYIGYLDKEKEKIYTPYFSIYGKNEIVPPMNLGQGLTSIVIREKKTLILNNATREEIEALGGRIIKNRHPRSWVGVPLISKDEAIGIISIQQYDIPNYFSKDDIKLLELLANSISSAVEKAYLFNEAKKREVESKIVAEISRQINSFLDLNKIIQQIIEIVFPVISHTTAAIYLKKDDGYFYGIAAVGKDSEIILNDKISPPNGIVGKSIAERKIIIENDLNNNPDAVQLEGTKEGSENEKIMSIPLFSEDEVQGALVIWREENEDKFDIHDQEFAENIAASISVALNNSKLYEKMNAAKKEAEYANLMKTQFLSNMSHELRTPLNSIINFSFLIQKALSEKDYPEEYDMLKRIEESGRYLLSLINDILDLAKIESGRMELYKEFFNLNEIIGSILSNAQALIDHKPISLITDIQQDLPYIYADKTRLRQILFNLISNSVKFTKEGYIKFSIKLEDEKDFLFSVEDTGIGIKQDDIEKAFKEFVQINGGLDREIKGTGLGLPITKKFIEMHEGKIWVKSEFGKGSIFYFTIPYRKNLEFIPTDTQVKFEDANIISENIKEDASKDILIIDDEEDFIRYIDKELNKKMKIISCIKADEVFDLVDKYKPDLIFLDLIMPKIDGWTILKKLKSEPKYMNIPVIVCSILNEVSYAKELKADGYITKPAEKYQLQEIFKNLNINKNEGIILIIDDDKNNIDILTSYITEKMYNIDIAKTSKDGIKKISSLSGKEVIILDLMLPDSDGFDLLKKLENKLPFLPNIIIVSNRDLTNKEKEYIKKRKIQYIRKDQFSKEKFLNILQKGSSFIKGD